MLNFKKWQEWVVPISVVACLFVILTPLPTFVVDFLLAANMIAAIIILSAALLAKSSLELTVFPSILLISTLGRLVLNISTTRLILSNATTSESLAAGGIIKNFGEYVIGNQVFVGIVIFAIIFIVQFVVVTKGTSRISEVAARFALDGMPGKQMAIDADLKSKLIDAEQARSKREELQEQADFLGAMDGAGRFVRGDAVAGLIITLVNIVGGLAIGLLNGMSFSSAVEVYTKLTIGDGLASQLPAFLIAIAAGVLMARGSRSGSVSDDLIQQVIQDPRVLFLAGFGAVAFGFIGMPPIPLFLVAGICFFFGAQGYFRIQDEEKASIELENEKQRSIKRANVQPTERLEDLLRSDQLEIRLGVGIVHVADKSKGGTLFEELNTVRKSLLMEYGFVLPKIRLCDNIEIKENHFQIFVAGNLVCQGEVQHKSMLAVDQGNTKAPIHGKKVSTLFGDNCFWIEPNQEHRAEFLRYKVLSSVDTIAGHLRLIALKFSGDLLTRDCVGKLIDELRKQSPVVVEDLIPTKMSLSNVQQVLKNLLQEGISIRQLGLILETLGDYSPHTNQVTELVELVRQRLSRSICSKYATNCVLNVIEFEESLEKRLIEQVTLETQDLRFENQMTDNQQNGEHDWQGNQTFLENQAFGANEISWFVKQIKQLQQPENTSVLLVDQRIRRWLKKQTLTVLPSLNVLGRSEVCPDFDVQTIGEISLQPNVNVNAA